MTIKLRIKQYLYNTLTHAVPECRLTFVARANWVHITACAGGWDKKKHFRGATFLGVVESSGISVSERMLKCVNVF